MRIRKKKWAEPELNVCNFYIKNPEIYKGKWREKFKNEGPLYVELGCGKGTFIAELGVRNPEINFIAVDIKNDMLGVARRNIVKLYEEKNTPVDNIFLVQHNIEQIFEVFGKDDRVERIYINFCNPWPKSQHKKRRLTFVKKLEMYKEFLVPNGEIFLKTDDDGLFRESIEYFKQAQYNIIEICYDYNDEKDIKTEHQKMFEEKGIKTKFLHARL